MISISFRKPRRLFRRELNINSTRKEIAPVPAFPSAPEEVIVIAYKGIFTLELPTIKLVKLSLVIILAVLAACHARF